MTLFAIVSHEPPPAWHRITAMYPRDAALKAASKGVTNIVLLDVERARLHFFEGSREELPVSLQTPFAAAHEMRHRGKAYRLASISLRKPFRLSVPDDVEHLRACCENVTGIRAHAA